MREAGVELSDGLAQRVNLFREENQVHLIIGVIFHFEALQSLSVLLFSERALQGFVFVGENLRLHFFVLSFGDFDLGFVIKLNFVHLVDEGLGELTSLENVLVKVLGGRAKLEHVGVESWHVWLDMIEKESLQEVGSVDSHWNLLEENGHGKAIVSDFIL